MPSGSKRSRHARPLLSFPYPLRFLFATRPAVLTQVLGIVYRAVSTFLIRRAGLRVGAGARTGAVTLIQRFGSALNLNPHLHMLFVDGAYAFDDEAPRFHRVAAPTQAELQRLLHANGFTAIEDMRYTRGGDTLRTYRPPEARYFSQVFCPTCGSGMPRHDPERGVAIIPFGSLDDDPRRRADDHIFVGSMAPWYEITDDLPCFDEAPG